MRQLGWMSDVKRFLHLIFTTLSSLDRVAARKQGAWYYSPMVLWRDLRMNQALNELKDRELVEMVSPTPQPVSGLETPPHLPASGPHHTRARPHARALPLSLGVSYNVWGQIRGAYHSV